MQAIQQHIFAVREILSPVLKESKFREHGRITPEEFVAAGDFLVYKFPVWTWEAGDQAKYRDFLPADKQYLVTRGVPCLRRASSLAYTDADEERLLNTDGEMSTGGTGGDDEWVETHAGRKTNVDGANNPGVIDDIPDDDDGISNGVSRLNLSGGGGSGAGDETIGEIPDFDEIPDMDEEDLEGEDEATVAVPKPKSTPPVTTSASTSNNKGAVIDSRPQPNKSNLLSVRTYDVMITYDKYYQTPRVWLIGYDENRNPLKTEDIFQDISADHAHKTVTIEPFIHSTSLQAASVHPCKHASVMKKVIERMNSSVVAEQLAAQGKLNSQQGQGKDVKGGSGSGSGSGEKKKWFGGKSSGKKDGNGKEEVVEAMRVDFYLVVFLKFIASIVPTIEVDSTTSF